MDLEHARQLLAAERTRLEQVKQAAGRLSTPGELRGEAAGTAMLPAEAANETIEREVDLNVMQQVDREINEVEDALRRIEEGSYGLCERCGAPIGDGRLEVMPAARLCLEHQSKARR
ncbi:MAG TPA: TraR/DksA C4-type zinc finger protein [Candidatus Sulfotelmatobacter sp.]|nr:TraR/DksA C4-type zinc finger protein [Candidatus Sulfotelmatobacter sp.]